MFGNTSHQKTLISFKSGRLHLIWFSIFLLSLQNTEMLTMSLKHDEGRGRCPYDPYQRNTAIIVGKIMMPQSLQQNISWSKLFVTYCMWWDYIIQLAWESITSSLPAESKTYRTLLLFTSTMPQTVEVTGMSREIVFQLLCYLFQRLCWWPLSASLIHGPFATI